MPKPPIRQNALRSSTTADIIPEVEAQLQARKKRRTAERKKARPKATYDLPPKLLDAIDDISNEESIAKSDIVTLAIIRFLDDYKEGVVEID